MVYSDIESALGKFSLLFVVIKNHDLRDIRTNSTFVHSRIRKILYSSMEIGALKLLYDQKY